MASNRPGSAWRRCGDLRQPEVPHCARLDERGHRADGVFDGRARVRAVQVVQVDVVRAEMFEQLLDGDVDVRGRAVDAALGRCVRAEAELGREEDLDALACALKPGARVA